MKLGYGLLILTFMLDLVTHVFSYRINDRQVIDLMQYVGLPSERTPSIQPIPGPNRHSTAYQFTGAPRRLEASAAVWPRLSLLLGQQRALTLLASVRQEEGSSGSVIAFTRGHQRCAKYHAALHSLSIRFKAQTKFLELESSGRRDEVRVHMVTQAGRPHTETFPVHLADDQWHLVALSIAHKHIKLYIDCQLVYQRQLSNAVDFSFIHQNMPSTSSVSSSSSSSSFSSSSSSSSMVLPSIPPLPSATPVPSSAMATAETSPSDSPSSVHENSQSPLPSLSLWLGQRTSKSAYFEGAIEYVKIVALPEGYLEQCPHADVACPTCSQFLQLEDSVAQLQTVIESLEQKLLATESRLSGLESCECIRGCEENGTRYRDGETWQRDHCTRCACRAGSVKCEQPRCPPVRCKHPVHNPADCCPKCLDHCYTRGRYFDHGEVSSPRKCVSCVCQDGSMLCSWQEPATCPPLPCTPDQQVAVPGECCMYCKGADYCAAGHDCHVHAACVNLATRYVCECGPGYQGDGRTCHDQDECSTRGGIHGHHCHSNTICVNTIGGYQCACQPGYIRLDSFTCTELDECAADLHDCDVNARCVNTDGSYECQCNNGYRDNGTTCQPVCKSPCQHGGRCVAPETCQCLQGYLGRSCQLDLDECSVGVAQCHPNSECVNTPGSYWCRCRSGYHSPHSLNHHGHLCYDVDECAGWASGHQCPAGTVCRNTPGGYECVCADPTACKPGCYADGSIHANGSRWQSPRDQCSTCLCQAGRVTCRPPPCDCLFPGVSLQCCPSCDVTQQCAHPELPITYNSGDTWLYRCQKCQCLHGEVDCWPLSCPPLSCVEHVHVGDECCPRCQEDDPCSATPSPNDVTAHNDVIDRTCNWAGAQYMTGHEWSVTKDSCTRADCRDGAVCFTYSTDEACQGDNTLDSLGVFTEDFDLSQDHSEKNTRSHGDAAVLGLTTHGTTASPLRQQGPGSERGRGRVYDNSGGWQGDRLSTVSDDWANSGQNRQSRISETETYTGRGDYTSEGSTRSEKHSDDMSISASASASRFDRLASTVPPNLSQNEVLWLNSERNSEGKKKTGVDRRRDFDGGG